MNDTIHSVAIGIDVGGTWMRAGAVDATGRVLALRRIPTSGGAAGHGLNFELAQLVGEVREETNAHERGLVAIGLAVPGVVDRDSGVILRSINLPALEDPGFIEEFTDLLGLRPTLVTDADAATWGEYVCCTPRSDRFVHLRLGTGVACGVILDGILQSTGAGRATHWDALVVDSSPGALPCPCGLRGCLETVASWSTLERAAVAAGLSDGISGLPRARADGEDRAVRVIREAGSAIALAMDNLCERFQPEIISLGGGVIDALPLLVDEVAALIGERPSSGDGSVAPMIEAARLGDDAGVIGAAMLARAASDKSTPPT